MQLEEDLEEHRLLTILHLLLTILFLQFLLLFLRFQLQSQFLLFLFQSQLRPQLQPPVRLFQFQFKLRLLFRFQSYKILQ